MKIGRGGLMAYGMRCGYKSPVYGMFFTFGYISCDNQIDPVSFRVVFGNHDLLGGELAWVLVQVINCRVTKI